jgi:hypothetical protein
MRVRRDAGFSDDALVVVGFFAQEKGERMEWCNGYIYKRLEIRRVFQQKSRGS